MLSCIEDWRRKIKKLREKGLSANALKFIAISAMLFQHSVYALSSSETSDLLIQVAGFIGYITGPIMFYLLVEGYHHTRNYNKYILRLLGFALISYVPFILVWSGGRLPNTQTWLDLNIGFTLMFALLLLKVRHEVNNRILKFVFYILLFSVSEFGDWGYRCLLIVLIFDIYYKDFENQRIIYCLYTFGVSVLPIALNPIKVFANEGIIDTTFLPAAFGELGLFLPIILLTFYTGEKGHGGVIAKWSFYIIYPLHLLFLFFLSKFIL